MNPLTVITFVLEGASPFETIRVRTMVPVSLSFDFILHENMEPFVGSGSIAPINVDVGIPVMEEGKAVVFVVVRVVPTPIKSLLTDVESGPTIVKVILPQFPDPKILSFSDGVLNCSDIVTCVVALLTIDENAPVPIAVAVGIDKLVKR